MLLLKNIVFTVLVPGTVVVLLPYLVLGTSGRSAPVHWGAPQLVAIPLGAVGLLIYLRCLWDFATRGRGTPAPIDPPTVLVVQGLYRYVRNPMYVGIFLVLLAEVLFFGSGALAIYLGAWFLLVNLFVIFYEEPVLQRTFGHPYAQYRRAVRRWVPGTPYPGVHAQTRHPGSP
jgi:protein-S-isoprenylcysteine O-methyltransferase Ste14